MDEVELRRIKLSYGDRKVCLKVPTNTPVTKLKEMVAEKLGLSDDSHTVEYYDSISFNDWLEVDEQYQLPECGELRVVLYDKHGKALQSITETGAVEHGVGIAISMPIVSGGEPVNNGSHQTTIEGDEDSKSEEEPELMVYCTEADCYGAGEEPVEDEGTLRPQDTSGAYVQKTKIWQGRNVLRVYFMNPGYLSGGKYPMTVETIMAWAGAWSNAMVPSIPKFERTDSKNDADIRVKFGSGLCWSKVGSDAKLVKKMSEPTMLLSLKDLPIGFQQYLVTHEFGHSLGLLHEHQRSDFWSVMDNLLDVNRMKADTRMASVNFNVDILKHDVPDGETTEYDPDSIMHYWFDLDWLKHGNHRNLRKVLSDRSLTEKQKQFLEGIHKRHRSYASEPSKMDLQFLEKCYASQAESSATVETDTGVSASAVGVGEPTKKGAGHLPDPELDEFDKAINEIADNLGINLCVLDQRFAEKNIRPVSKNLTNWIVYAPMLLGSHHEIEQQKIDQDHALNGYAWQKPEAMLKRWRQIYYAKKQSHYRYFLRTILEGSDDRNLVEKILKSIIK